MTIRLPDSVRSSRLDEIAAHIGSNARIRIYDGVQPATGGGALSGNTLLAEFTAGAPFAPAAAAGVLTANSIADVIASNDGIASWFRIVQSDLTTWALDGTCGTSGADLNLNTVEILAGGPVSILSIVMVDGNPA